MDRENRSPLTRGSNNAIYDILLGVFRRRPRKGEGLVLDILAALAAALFANTALPFGAHPLALSLLAAVRGHALAVLLGAMAGAAFYGRGGAVYLAVYGAVFFLRLAWSWPKERRFLPSSPHLFGEAPQLRVCAALVGGLLLGAYELIVGGVATPSLLFALSSVLFPPLLTFFYVGAFCGEFLLHDFLLSPHVERVRESREIFWSRVGVMAVLFSCGLALAPYSLFGISAGGVFATAVFLVAAKRFGPLQGAAAGFVAALPLGPLMAPAYGFAGFVAGALRKRALFLPMAAAVAVGSAWCAYVGGLSGFLGNMPELAVTTLLVWPLTYRIPVFGGSEGSKQAPAALPPPGLPTSQERLSTAFSSLSRLLAEEESALPVQAYLVCHRICAARCGGCERRSACWESGDRPALEAVSALAAKPDGEPTGAVLTLRALCPEMETWEPELRSALQGATHREKGESAEGFDLVAKLLRETAARDRAASKEDLVLGEELKAALCELGIHPGGVCVRGERRRHITASGLRWDGRTLPAEKLHREVERLCGTSLSYPGFQMEEGFVSLRMQTVRRYGITVTTASAPSPKEEESGDTTAFFPNEEDYFYVLLSDGMGSGREAARTSALCVEILRTVLLAGNNQETSLYMLNRLLRRNRGECSATVDLLEVDLLYGKASFVKSGAAASYVKRGETLFRIHANTPPMGILREPEAERIHFSVRPGDVIVLLSDGISQSVEDAPWLLEYLASPWLESPEESAAHILELAKSHGGEDDMTVVLATVTTASAASTAASTAMVKAG